MDVLEHRTSHNSRVSVLGLLLKGTCEVYGVHCARRPSTYFGSNQDTKGIIIIGMMD